LRWADAQLLSELWRIPRLVDDEEGRCPQDSQESVREAQGQAQGERVQQAVCDGLQASEEEASTHILREVGEDGTQGSQEEVRWLSRKRINSTSRHRGVH